MKNPLILLINCMLLVACKKEFDLPPVKQASDGSRISITQIKSLYRPNINYKFKADSNLYCVVTADEVSGNLYKEIFVRDASGAIHLKLKNSGGLYIGDSIRINLKGLILNAYNGLIQLDSVDVERSVVKLVSGVKVSALNLSLEQVMANTAASNTVQSRLVKITNLEFMEEDRNLPLADAIGKSSVNLRLRSCSGQSITLRSSGYANFASQLSPSGSGYIIAIVSQFGENEDDMQLILRQYSDLVMKDANCSVSGNKLYLKKDFNDNSISSGGWSQYKVSGNVMWSTSSAGGVNSPYAKISNYNSGTNQSCETWLISPLIDLKDAIQPVLSFRNAYNYEGPELELYVSANYSSGLPSSANWTKLNFTLSSGNWIFVDSGSLDLSAFKHQNIRIAFKYTGSDSAGSTWEIDDILVKEN